MINLGALCSKRGRHYHCCFFHGQTSGGSCGQIPEAAATNRSIGVSSSLSGSVLPNNLLNPLRPSIGNCVRTLNATLP